VYYPGLLPAFQDHSEKLESIPFRDYRLYGVRRKKVNRGWSGSHHGGKTDDKERTAHRDLRQ
jgi:hypothetical protein